MMNKKDVQALYKEVKRNRKNNKRTDLTKPKKGCKSCGRVTWKPNKTN
ncbi:hypothetical protein ABFG93_03325 [Pseudalkalibacillus hwajinpoensis]